ncbi:Transmembrane protein 165, partial [Tupaia chinensis]
QKGFTPAAPAVADKEDAATQTNLGFVHAFIAAISVIIVSELGDKTFFIAAIMAMRYNRLTVLAGAMLALGLMTCLSVLFGYATTVIPRVYTYYVSTALFAIFGVRMLREGLKMSPDEGQEELEEVQAELKKKDEEFQRTKLLNGPGDVEAGTSTAIPQKKWLHFISPIFVQALTLTFLAEWGDRSQLTTIVLAAREDPYGVAVGGTVGHCLCTGLAVIGGRMIAQKISVRTGKGVLVPWGSGLPYSPKDGRPGRSRLWVSHSTTVLTATAGRHSCWLASTSTSRNKMLRKTESL